MSDKLRTESAFERPDDFYDLLLETHRGLDDEASAMVNAKLILLLSNHIGDLDVIREALALARAGT